MASHVVLAPFIRITRLGQLPTEEFFNRLFSLIKVPWLVVGFQQGRRKLLETGRNFLQSTPGGDLVESGGHT